MVVGISMKPYILIVLLMFSRMAFAGSLPVFSVQPTNQTVYPGANATWVAAASGATGYQWLFDGVNIAGATNATFVVTNAQSTNCGYYMVLAGNSTGWVPSQLAYLMLDYTRGGTVPSAAGTLPFSNTNNTYFAGQILDGNTPPLNGTVQIVAGPQLDEMNPVGRIVNYGTLLRVLGIVYTNGY
jgi:hypothetical protein